MKRVLMVLAVAGILMAAASGTATSRAFDDDKKLSVFATGLDNPRGLVFAPDGPLVVAEAGRGGTTSTVGMCPHTAPPIGPFLGGKTARVSQIARNGARTTMAARLPSGQTAPESGREVLGAEDVVFLGDVPYLLTQGGGCSKGNPDFPNGIYRLNPNGSTTLVANLTAFFSANPTGGPQDDDRDPEGVPTSMVAVGRTFYVLEGNHAQLVEVKLDGAIRRVADLSLAVGQKTFTALAYGPDGNFYVGSFGEVPYPDGSAALYRVTPAGQVSLVASGLTTVIDMKFDCDGRLYILESSTGNTPQPPFLVPGSGRVRVRTGGQWTTVASGLTFPTGIAFGPDGDLYISNIGYGQGPSGGLGQVLRAKIDPPARNACR